MTNYIFINGSFITESKARISVEDAGFLYGDGVFESIRSYYGNPFKLEEHLDRLFSSLEFLKYNLHFDKAYIKSAIFELLLKNRLSQEDAYIKIIITRSKYGQRFHYDFKIKPDLIIIAKKMLHYSDEYYINGVKIISSDLKRSAKGNDLNKYKLLNYFENIYVRNEAYSKQCFEGIFTTGDGLILECSMSNIFYVKNGKIFTPPLDQDILPGITRQAIINLCKENDLKISESIVSYAEIVKADEVFLTNSLMEIMPVKEIDNYEIGTKIPGPFTFRLMEYYKKSVEYVNFTFLKSNK